ncbi:TPA: hypothetical protein O7V46_004799 [Escherichia coli]|nr:hypothetical protein [Escherichia coli]EKY5157504.1 hypothetical protein [Escherichia coli]HDC1081326.1 hypothetical protein [Escherichia coli]HDC1342688.1 hypothetical protein [Escherichia coli]HDC1882115.1 hypothetical protein [Escherichia coli]
MMNRIYIALFFSLLCEVSDAKLNTFLDNSNLTTSLSAVADIPPFMKQGDTLSIRTLTPPGSGALYTGTLKWTSGDTVCSSPSIKPYKYEVYNWPAYIEMENMRLDLIDSESMGIEIGTAPRICADYQPGGSATGTLSNRVFVGSGMKRVYRVSQIYQAGSSSKIVNIPVMSGRSEYAELEIISKLRNYIPVFRPVSVNLTTIVKNWCSASVGPGKDIALSHGTLMPVEVPGNISTSIMQLSCQGEGADFKLKWFGGRNAGNSKEIALGKGISSTLKINGLSGDGKVYVPANSTVSLTVSSTLKISGELEAGDFSASQTLIIDVS